MNKEKPNELPIPPAARADGKAIELLRIWAAGGQQHVTLAASLWEAPECWGVMLVDLAKHLAIAYQQSNAVNPAETLRRIKAGFDAEWSEPTDSPHGRRLK